MHRPISASPIRPSRATGQTLLTIGVFLLGVVISGVLAVLAHRSEVARFESAIAGETRRYAASFEEKVEVRLLAIERMANRWTLAGDMHEEALAADARLYLEHMNGFVRLAAVSPELDTLWSVDLTTVTPAALAPEARPARVAAARSAAQREATVLSGAFPLQSSGTGIASFTPVLAGGRLTGFLEGRFQFEHLVTDFAKAEGLDLVLQPADGPFAAPDPPLGMEEACATTEVGVRNSTWRLRACPTAERLEEQLSVVPAEIFVAGLLVSGLVAALVDRARTARSRTAQVEEANRQLGETVAELSANQEELRAQQAELSERAAVMEARRHDLALISQAIAHDLRSPLRAMDAYSRVLAEEYAPRLDDAGRTYLARISAGASRMGRLLDELLAFARVARAGVHREPLDVSGLARAVGNELAAAEPERKVDLRVEEGIHVDADPGLTRALLEELLDNAWKFTRLSPSPRVDVRIDEEDGHRWLCVTDNGVGFDPRWASRLFRPFERLHADASFEGPGMGLAIAWRIAQLHGGEVRIDAEEGQGAAVRVRLEP